MPLHVRLLRRLSMRMLLLLPRLSARLLLLPLRLGLLLLQQLLAGGG